MRDETARDVFLRRLRIFPRGNLKRQDSENIPCGTNSRFVNLERRRDWKGVAKSHREATFYHFVCTYNGN